MEASSHIAHSASESLIYEPPNVRHISLSMTEDYASKWGLWEGVREIVQNWHDGVHHAAEALAGSEQSKQSPRVNFKKVNDVIGDHSDRYIAVCRSLENPLDEIDLGEIRYDPESNILYLINREISLTKKILLMGFSSKISSKTADPQRKKEVIGQFGEGLKIGALALLRVNHLVSMETSKVKWQFEIKDHAEFGERVLTVCATDRVPRSRENEDLLDHSSFPECPVPLKEEDTCTTISSLTKQEWEEVVERFLFLTPPHNFEQTDIGQLLLDEKHAAQLYVKGMWVADYKKEDLSAGVDFLEMELDRDRHTISKPSDIDHHVSYMWIKAVEQNPDRRAGEYYNLMQTSTYRDVKHTAQYASRNFCMLMDEQFQVHNPGNVFAASNQSDQQELNVIKNELQREVVLCTDTLLKVLIKSGRHMPLQEAIKRHKIISEAKIIYVSLTDEERTVLEHAVYLSKVAEPTFTAASVDVIDTAEFENVSMNGDNLHVPRWCFNLEFVHQLGTFCQNKKQCKCRELFLCVQFLYLRPDKRNPSQMFSREILSHFPPGYDLTMMFVLTQLIHQTSGASPPYCHQLHQSGQVLDYSAMHEDCKERETAQNKQILKLETHLEAEVNKAKEKFTTLDHKLSVTQRELMDHEIKYSDEDLQGIEDLRESYEKKLVDVREETRNNVEKLQEEYDQLQENLPQLEEMTRESESRTTRNKTFLKEKDEAWRRKEHTIIDELSHYVDKISDGNTKMKVILTNEKEKALSQEMSNKCTQLMELCDKLSLEIQKDTFRCTVCMDRMRDTVFTSCGHLVCCRCATKILDETDDEASDHEDMNESHLQRGMCPACKKPVDKEHTIKMIE